MSKKNRFEKRFLLSKNSSTDMDAMSNYVFGLSSDKLLKELHKPIVMRTASMLAECISRGLKPASIDPNDTPSARVLAVNWLGWVEDNLKRWGDDEDYEEEVALLKHIQTRLESWIAMLK